MTTKTIREDLVKRMQYWQGIERKSVASTGAVIEKTAHPLVLLVMEIIQKDSQLHHRVQQFIIDAIESRPITLAPEQLGEVAAELEHHLRLEEQMAEAVSDAREKIKGRKMLVEEYLLDFLVQDEKKHFAMLQALDKVKRGLYPYA